jgi:hypothetical protein
MRRVAVRKIVLALAVGAAFTPLPALAQDAAEDSGLARAAEEMRDPVRQEQVAVMAEAVIASLLEMPFGNLLRSAAEIAGEDPDKIDPNTTLREAAGPEADDAPRLAAKALPKMMSATGALAGALETMLPEMRRIGEDLARQFPEVGD